MTSLNGNMGKDDKLIYNGNFNNPEIAEIWEVRTPEGRTVLIVGAAYTLIGASNRSTNHGRFERLEQEYKESPSTFVQKEKERVDGFQYMYKISKAVATVFFLAALVIFWTTKHPTWQGIGMGLTLFGLAGLAVDYFSQNRAEAYYEVIMKAIGT